TSELRLRYKFVVPWSKMIRSSIVKKNNILFEEISVSNDILFSAKVGYYAADVTISSNEIYSVRESASSLTSIINEERFKIRIDAWIDYAVFLKENLYIQDYKKLHISALPQLLQVYRNKINPYMYIYIVKKCLKNRISLFDVRLLDIKFLRRTIKKINRVDK